MSNNLLNMEILSQEFPSIEVEKNAKATFIESFEEYLEEEYGILNEASFWDKLKDKASELKKTVTGKKLSEVQKLWFKLSQEGIKSLEDKNAWVVASPASREAKELSNKLSKLCSDYHVIYCKDSRAADPMKALYISKAFDKFIFALSEASFQTTSSIKDELEEYKAIYGYSGLPILVCANRGKAADEKAKLALQSCPQAMDFGLNVGHARVLAVVVVFPGGSSGLYVSKAAFEIVGLADDKKSDTGDKPEDNSVEKAGETPEEKSTEKAEAPQDTTQSTEPKNAKLNRARQANLKIINAFKEVGLGTDDLTVIAKNKNGKDYKKASDKLNKLRKTLFGESFDPTAEEELLIDED